MAIDSTTMQSSQRRGEHGVAYMVVNMATTGTRPPQKTALHLACDGSDVTYSRHRIVAELLTARADMEARDPKGNTPFLMAAGVGITNVVKLLIESGADRHVTNHKGQGALQKARGHSTDVKRLLIHHGCRETHAPSDQQRTGTGDQRMSRYVQSVRDPWSQWFQSCKPPRKNRG